MRKIKPLDNEAIKGNEVRVYRNLHNGLFSVQLQSRENRSWRVEGHTGELILTNCTFKVCQGGRQRVLVEGRKNVHAYICGFVDYNLAGGDLGGDLVEVSYNPQLGYFYRKDTMAPVTKANKIALTAVRVLASL